MKIYLLFVVSCLICLCARSQDIIPSIEPSGLTYPEQLLERSQSLDQVFNRHLFSPWHVSRDSLRAFLESQPGKDGDFLDTYLNDPDYYGENKQRHSINRKQRIAHLANFENFPNLFQKGITVRNSSIRRLPTNKPGYDTYSKAGEGFPFDYFQETAIWVNTPILIVHGSADHSWYYIVSGFYKGWIPADDIAEVDESFLSEWQKDDYLAILKDETAVKDLQNQYIFSSGVGSVFPLTGVANDNAYEILTAVPNEDRRAVIKRAWVSKSTASPKPLPMTGEHLRHLISELEGKPYGWGGLLGNRDCSSTLKDMFTPFGLWLPRNSGDQAVCGTRTIELTGEPQAKLKTIREQGVPFATILYKRGHAMLYVGQDQQESPLIFHNVWGLKTVFSDPNLEALLSQYPIEGIHQDPKTGQLKGRQIIGRSIITPVTLGLDIPEVDKAIIEELEKMTILVP